MNDYTINYDDERFKNVETEKQTQLDNLNNTYNNMVNQSDQFYQNQINAARDYANTQQDIQNQQTNLAVNEINQAKEQQTKSYNKEQKGAYVDYQKQLASNSQNALNSGQANSGYNATFENELYTTYQNRVSTARESYNNAIQNYDNAIAEARLQNSSKLAEIAYQALQTELELSLNGFQYKNQLLLNQIDAQQNINNTYYARWQDVLGQMNTENAMAENIRQFNENKAFQEKQLAENIRQYNETFNENVRQYNENMAFQKQQAAQDQANWEKQYALSKSSSKSSGSSSKSSSSSSTKLSSGSSNSNINNTSTNNSEEPLFKTYDDVYNWLKGQGYSDKEAKEMADTAWTKAGKTLPSGTTSTSSNTKSSTNTSTNKTTTTTKTTTSSYLKQTYTPTLSTNGTKWYKNNISNAKVSFTQDGLVKLVYDAKKKGNITADDYNKILNSFGLNSNIKF